MRSDQNGVEVGLIRAPGKVVEEIHHILRNAWVAGEQAHVGIEARGLSNGGHTRRH